MYPKRVYTLSALYLLTGFLDISYGVSTSFPNDGPDFSHVYRTSEKVLNELKKQNLTWSPDLDTWEAPAEMRNALPYYLAGYDYEKRPVIIVEYGKWELRKYFDAGEETGKLYDKYVEQLWWRMKNLKSPFPDAEDGVFWINDMKGFSLQQASVEVIQNQLVQSRRLEAIQDQISEVIWINMSFIAQVWLDILRPLAGKVVGRIDTYGQQIEKWAPVLASKIPKDSLPPWYGGSNNFKALQVY